MGHPAAVLVGYAPPERQSRVTIGFRLILAVPHLIVLMIFTLVGTVVTVAAWFAALVTGRVPTGMFSFVARLVRYGTRVYAYCWLLTDHYPPFDGRDDSYPISVEFTRTPLNRAAVFFRLILALPVQVVSTLVNAGATVAGVFIWVIALIGGKLPRSIYEALAATLRFQARLISYVALLTPAYPAGLFGDTPDPFSDRFEPTLPASSPAAGPGVVMPPTFATPVPSPPPFPPPQFPPPHFTPPHFTPPQVAPEQFAPEGLTFAPPPAGATRPRATRLFLSKSAKRLIVLFLVLGAIDYVAIGVLSAVNGKRVAAIGAVNDSYTTLTDATRSYEKAVAACGTNLACVQGADRDLAPKLTEFASALADIDFPSGSKAAAAQLESDAQDFAAVLSQLAAVPTLASYRALAGRLQTIGAQFDADYTALARTL